jgi:hypothetical protein
MLDTRNKLKITNTLKSYKDTMKLENSFGGNVKRENYTNNIIFSTKVLMRLTNPKT